jgi:hypothetical protein
MKPPLQRSERPSQTPSEPRAVIVDVWRGAVGWDAACSFLRADGCIQHAAWDGIVSLASLTPRVRRVLHGHADIFHYRYSSAVTLIRNRKERLDTQLAELRSERAALAKELLDGGLPIGDVAALFETSTYQIRVWTGAKTPRKH